MSSNSESEMFDEKEAMLVKQMLLNEFVRVYVCICSSDCIR